MVGHFEFEKVEIFQGISLHGNAHLFHSNGLAIWHGLPDIRHIKVKYDPWSAILRWIELKNLTSVLRIYQLG